MPSSNPRLVEVGQETFITMTFAYYTNSSRRDNLVRKLLGRLAEFGINIPASRDKGG
jgi:hypothetical protein